MDPHRPTSSEDFTKLIAMVSALLQRTASFEELYNEFSVDNDSLLSQSSQVLANSVSIRQENAKLKEQLASEKTMRERLEEVNGYYAGMIYNATQLIYNGPQLYELIIEAGSVTGQNGGGTATPEGAVQITSREITGRLNMLYNFIKQEIQQNRITPCVGSSLTDPQYFHTQQNVNHGFLPAGNFSKPSNGQSVPGAPHGNQRQSQQQSYGSPTPAYTGHAQIPHSTGQSTLGGIIYYGIFEQLPQQAQAVQTKGSNEYEGAVNEEKSKSSNEEIQRDEESENEDEIDVGGVGEENGFQTTENGQKLGSGKGS